jgi:hypothetical protein
MAPRRHNTGVDSAFARSGVAMGLVQVYSDTDTDS